jgi:hypothetical protein
MQQLFSDNLADYEIIWKKNCRGGQATDDNTAACWIHKATNTLSEYVILIAFLLQEWSKERASMLR